MPEISDWNTFEDWEKAGKRDVLQIAREKCDYILQKRQPMLLPVEVDQEIKNFLNLGWTIFSQGNVGHADIPI